MLKYPRWRADPYPGPKAWTIIFSPPENYLIISGLYLMLTLLIALKNPLFLWREALNWTAKNHATELIRTCYRILRKKKQWLVSHLQYSSGEKVPMCSLNDQAGYLPLRCLSFTVRNVLADFAACGRYCKALCNVNFSQIEGNGGKWSHRELSNSAFS